MTTAPHQGLPVSGYRPQSDQNVELVNQNKALEERVLRQLDKLFATSGLDPRRLSVARATSIRDLWR